MTRKLGNTEEEYRKAAVDALSIADMCRNLGILPKGANYKTMNRVIARYSIDTSHFLGQAHNLGKVLVENPVGRESIKKKLILSRGHKCELCSRTTWMGQTIKLEVEHIDGVTENNDESNLLLLCPNCHSLTPTWRRAKSSLVNPEEKICPKCSGSKTRSAVLCSSCKRKEIAIRKMNQYQAIKYSPKNLKNYCKCGKVIAKHAKNCSACYHSSQNRIDWPNLENLIEDIKATSYLTVSKNLGVSDNAIRKHLRNRGIDAKTLKSMV